MPELIVVIPDKSENGEDAANSSGQHSGEFAFPPDPLFQVHQPIHTSFDDQGAVVSPVQRHLLDAVEEYLKWLDFQNEGEP
jgi:hypothetical protein